MSNQCEIVRDLLPLYLDGACSGSSAQMIEGHLAECEACTKVWRAMQADSYEKALRVETEDVIAHHVREQKRKTLLVGAGIAGILCIPILVCLIVNLALGHTLDWFFIVLTSLMVFASVVVVPLVAEKQKGLYTILCFAGSLVLLLLACALYTGGAWFFVAATSVLFGLSVVFMPYLAHALPLPEFWKKNRGLCALGIDTILFALMLASIGFYIGSSSYWSAMPPIALYNAAFVWVIFLVCRYLGKSRWIRAGAASMIIGCYVFSINNVINRFLGEDLPWPELNLAVWNMDTADGNIKWLILLGGILVGVVCIVVGIVRRNHV